MLSLGLPDKVHHTYLYAILGLLTFRALSRWPSPISKWAFLAAIAFNLLYGASDEWHQSFVPNRTPDFFDWLADGAGTVLGVFIYWFYLKIKGTDYEVLR